MGFDGGHENPPDTMMHAKKTMRDENVPGFMMAPWGGLADDGIYYNKDGAIRLLRARERVYPETLN